MEQEKEKEEEYNVKEQLVELALINEIKKIYSKIASLIREIAKSHIGESDFSFSKYPLLKKKALAELANARQECEDKVRLAASKVASLAAEKNMELYGIDTDAEWDYNEEIFGKTFRERLGQYSNRFLSDMALIIASGVTISYIRMPKSSDKILSLASGAKKYGRGDAGSAMKNIQRLGADIIRRMYHQSYFNAWKASGKFKGYMIYRGSTYDCPICNYLPGKVYPMNVMILPAHVRCCCYAIPIEK